MTDLHTIARRMGAARGRQDARHQMPYRESFSLTRATLLAIVSEAYPHHPRCRLTWCIRRHRHGIELAYASGYGAARSRDALAIVRRKAG